MNQVLQRLLKFRRDRDWEQFHSPQNLAKSLVLEATEVLEIFQWKSTNSPITPTEKVKISEELADVYNWLILMANDLDIDIEKAALNKIADNEKKYPINKSKGSAKKYTEL